MAKDICSQAKNSVGRKESIAIRLSSSTICILVKIHQDKNRFLAFLMLSLGMTITVHHMEKSVFFLHMRFSQCLLRKEGEAMHEKLNIIIIMRWYGISERGAREERGEKMEKWKRSHFFARQQQQHQGTDACGTSELSRKNGLMIPMLCLLLSSLLLWIELPPLFFFFYGSRCTTIRLCCRARDPRKQIKREPSYHAQITVE